MPPRKKVRAAKAAVKEPVGDEPIRLSDIFIRDGTDYFRAMALHDDGKELSLMSMQTKESLRIPATELQKALRDGSGWERMR
ncbi:MAG: hypothetical protein KGH72_03360 [Candidatus Micrarchaeota archaeon]|nr:hypothetical protein [Candidatus Micrarchaeota archaeon]